MGRSGPEDLASRPLHAHQCQLTMTAVDVKPEVDWVKLDPPLSQVYVVLPGVPAANVPVPQDVVEPPLNPIDTAEPVVSPDRTSVTLSTLSPELFRLYAIELTVAPLMVVEP